MSLDMGGYGFYVWGSYAVFAALLAWDLLMPRLRLARARRAVRAREQREVARRSHR
ncbi:MAG TPA: heme exporter protein CcmD [Xanthomonadaceae bacterium]|nr:heme exporter protein CcmD [Xanthomonadaceae bacterium]